MRRTIYVEAEVDLGDIDLDDLMYEVEGRLLKLNKKDKTDIVEEFLDNIEFERDIVKPDNLYDQMKMDMIPKIMEKYDLFQLRELIGE